MRPIDADALSAFVSDLRSALYKEQSKFMGMTDIEFNTRDYMLLNFQYAIDNAPTVEVPENKVNCVLTMFGKCSYNETGCSDCEIKDKIHKALNARPAGEWIVGEYMGCHSDILPEYTCPFCGEVAYSKYDFCHCGADMRGGKE